jgi:hypothetical protein
MPTFDRFPSCGHRVAALGVLATAILLVAACSSTGSSPTTGGSGTKAGGAAAPITYQAVPDLPFAPGTTIDTERTLVLGSGERWMGRMALKSNLKSTQAYQYYLDQMPAFGWESVTAVQGKNSVLTWVRQERAATVEIAGTGFGGSTVDITVGPRGRGVRQDAGDKPEKLE